MKFDHIVLIDKPPNITSHEVTSYVRKMCGAPRAGHAGTLDPNVSGVLPIALGKATKLLRYIAGKDKTYIGIMRFKNVLSKEEILELFSKFVGTIDQLPPKISAVKRAWRKRKIHSLDLLEICEENPRLVLFKTKVDAGTYIRVLCEDIGKLCGGARMEELRRIAVGSIDEQETITMHQLAYALDNENYEVFKKPSELINFPKVHIKYSALKSIKSGAQIMVPAIENLEDAEKGSRMAIYCNNQFIGVGILINPDLERKKGLVVKLERIHIS